MGSKDYQSYLQMQLSTSAIVEADKQELQTPGVKQSNGYPQF